MVFVPWTCSILAGVSKGVNIKFQINVSLALTEKYLVNLPKAFEIKICCMHFNQIELSLLNYCYLTVSVLFKLRFSCWACMIRALFIECLNT